MCTLCLAFFVSCVCLFTWLCVGNLDDRDLSISQESGRPICQRTIVFVAAKESNPVAGGSCLSIPSLEPRVDLGLSPGHRDQRCPLHKDDGHLLVLV